MPTNDVTYNIPRIPQITMRPHEKSHGYDFEHHLARIYDQEYQINCVQHALRDTRIFVYGKEEAVDDNDHEDEPIKPWIDSHQLDDFVSEGVRHRKATK